MSVRERLEYLRGELRAGTLSYDELHELQSLAAHIAPSDVELLEAAGVPEFCEHEPAARVVPPLGSPLPTCRKCGIVYMPEEDDTDD